MGATPTFSASEVNLLIYHYLKESGFQHSCFTLRNESRLDDEPLSHEAVIEPGKLVGLLEKALVYMSVEAHVNADGSEKPCSAPFPLIGPEHICDGVAREPRFAVQRDKAAAAGARRLTPSPPPESARKLVETAVQTQAERRSISRESSAGLSASAAGEKARTNGHQIPSDDPTKIASSSKTKLEAVVEEPSRELKRRSDAKASKVTDKKARRAGTPKVNGRANTAPLDAEDGEGDNAEETQQASPAAAAPPAKKKRRGGTVSKGPASNGAAKNDKNSANAWVPPLTGKAKGKQASSRDIARLKGHTAEVFVSAWNPAVPGLIATGAGDATVRIWDMGSTILEDGKLGELGDVTPTVCKHLPATHAKDVSALNWNPDGTLLASGSYDGILRLWTPQGDLHLVMSMHQGPIFAVRWNRKGNLILSGSADGTAIVWDLGSGKTRQQFSLHSDSVLDIDWLTASMSENIIANCTPSTAADNTLATCSADNSINILRLGENRPIKTLKGHTDEVNAIRFDPTGTYLASVSDDATARIWNLEAILGSGYLGTSAPHLVANTSINGASGPGSGKRSSTTPRPTRGGSLDRMDVDDESSGAAADRSTDSSSALLGEGGNNGAASNANKLCRHVLTGHKKDIFAIAWAPVTPSSAADQSTPHILATASFDNTARIWNADDGTCLRVFQEHTDSVYSVCFSADRRFLVTGGMDHRLLVSSVQTGDIVLAHAGGGGVFDVAWHTGRPRSKGAIEASKGGGGQKSRIKSEDSNEAVPAKLSEANDALDSEQVNAGAGKQHLALSQADKTLTVLDVSEL